MGFEVYQKGSAPVSTVPTATIQKRGLISLNLAAFDLIEQSEGVELLYDSERKLIALRPAPLTNPNAYPARWQGKKVGKGPVLIAGSLFTRHIGLDTSEARRWSPRIQDGLLVIDLNEPGQRVVANRNRKKADEVNDTT